MNNTALFNLLLAVIGGPAVMVAVFLIARALVYRHAEQYGPAIRAAGRDLDTRAAAARRRAMQKELTHR